jgi:radical SAM protein with 4Fe4S-binding SPASM domain
LTKYLHGDRLSSFSLWKKTLGRSIPLDFELELTARCNNNCQHCYINLPANDRQAQAKELSIDEIADIADQAIQLGTLWVLLTGGEPLLRPDFAEIYLMLKRKGLLISVFTNATLIRAEHIQLFTKYPPRDMEVTIYGGNQATYEAVTRTPGSFNALIHGLDALFQAGIRPHLKAMVMRTNFQDLQSITALSQAYTDEYCRFDPVLHLRYDRDEGRNQEIRAQRLTPQEIVALEQGDQVRLESLEKAHDKFFMESFKHRQDNHIFTCGAGNSQFSVSYDGTFRLCSSLWAPGTVINLRKVKLRSAWERLVPTVRCIHTTNQDYLNACGKCPIVNLCLNCPAHAYLETGELDAVVPYFCQVAHARAEALKDSEPTQNPPQNDPQKPPVR